MYSPRCSLETPSDYEFPYTPYDIQQQLMESVYTVLERKGVGIFESPTGTGKSLTLTCAALRWLLDHEELVRQDLQRSVDQLSREIKQLADDGATASDWIESQHKLMQKRDELNELQRLKDLMHAYEQKLEEMRERRSKVAADKGVTGAKLNRGDSAAKVDSVDDFDDFNLVEEDLKDAGAVNASVEGVADEEEEEEETDSAEEFYKDVKIYFCSRTHSQLAQVVREVKRSAYGTRVRCISLASRQQLCINPEVRRLPGVALINERCLDLTNSRSRSNTSKPTSCDSNGCTQKKLRLDSSTKCIFKTASTLQDLTETALCKVLDIEDLVLAGERGRACPYYAARAATRYAQLVLLPYQMLLHRKTRLQSGIDLRHAVVIIDEAHNLLDTILQIHSAEINLQQLLLVQQQITAYKMRYASRFSTANLLKINQLNFIVKRLVKMLTPSSSSSSSSLSSPSPLTDSTQLPAPPQQSSRMLRTHELMSEGEFFNINVFHILEFCERTRFAQKLQGFAQRMQSEPQSIVEQQQQPAKEESAAVSMLKRLQQEHLERQVKRRKTLPAATAEEATTAKKETESVASSQSSSVIRLLLAFLETLTECAEDGRVLVNIDAAGDGKRSAFKYLLLNPGEHFREIVEQSRAIIIAGGTMQPTTELIDQLFKSCPERVVQKFYDHVVPADAVLPFVVTKGPTGKHFCFNYKQRTSQEMLSELAMTLQNLCFVIPAGVVCFLPSYDFLETVYTRLQQTGFLDRISRKKRVFREPRGNTGPSVEQMLSDYAATIKRKQGGALLLSVVGGKLSEGLNFADDLGRCVIVVGMPYPNRNSPELQERMKYLDETLGAGNGNEYYENLCIKAINQCIGRSVRHIRDYACVMLLDERYASERVQRKLPQWISRSLQVPASFGAVQGATAKFFKQKKPS